MPVNNDEEDKACPVCMEDFSNATSEDPIQKLEKCGHSFHQSCIQETFKHTQPQCPICKTWYGIPKGNQPRGSTMKYDKIKGAVPGFDCKEHIRISYYIPGGIQG
uniref:E3 ubiquitin-protein ligase n=1 Tax=Plectus sambesii TaxID=2011161 RepID=A0A914VG71_9BILA